MIIVGLFVTFFGARFFKHIVFFIGFILGAFIAYYSVPFVFEWFDSTVQDDTLLYMSLSIGALGGVLLVVVYKAAVFSCGAIGGAILSQILWIAVVSNVSVPDEDWMIGVQIGVLLLFALIGGWLAFKFVEQLLKAVTAFIGGFMFASGTAFFLSRLDQSDGRNVVDWVVFFGNYQNYTNLEAVCDIWCIVCFLIWIVFFAAGCFVQYKLHRKHKRKDNDDGYQSDSEITTEYERRKSDSGVIEMGMGYGGYAGSLRAPHHDRLGSQSSNPDRSMLANGILPSAPPAPPPAAGMGGYGGNHYREGR